MLKTYSNSKASAVRDSRATNCLRDTKIQVLPTCQPICSTTVVGTQRPSRVKPEGWFERSWVDL